MLIDNDGYAVLIDLGFARVVPGKTFTFCGTPMYIAPEIIRQKGYNNSADIWSWTVMLYEMLLGMNPFYEDGASQLQLFKRIVKAEYLIPPPQHWMALSNASIDLLARTLVPDPDQRLGCLAGGINDLKQHPFFGNHSMDFEKLQEKQVQPPWVPDVENSLDGANFEEWDDSKEEEKASTPLNEEEQKLFRDF